VIVVKTLIQFQNRRIPVYFTDTQYHKKSLDALLAALDRKVATGKAMLQKCLSSLISIEIVEGDAILHCKREFDTVALSLH
jgi:hypothetical protein